MPVLLDDSWFQMWAQSPCVSCSVSVRSPTSCVTMTSCTLTGRRIPLSCSCPVGMAGRGRADSSFPWHPSRWWRGLANTDRAAQGKQENEEDPLHSNCSDRWRVYPYPAPNWGNSFCREAKNLMKLRVWCPDCRWAVVWVILTYQRKKGPLESCCKHLETDASHSVEYTMPVITTQTAAVA